MLPPTVDATMRGPSQLSSGRGLLGVVLRERTYTIAGIALLLAVVIVPILFLAVVIDMNVTAILCRAPIHSAAHVELPMAPDVRAPAGALCAFARRAVLPFLHLAARLAAIVLPHHELSESALRTGLGLRHAAKSPA